MAKAKPLPPPLPPAPERRSHPPTACETDRLLARAWTSKTVACARIVIIGGGTAGITVAASLKRHAPGPIDIAVVEPSDTHYYQPAFTLVGTTSLHSR